MIAHENILHDNLGLGIRKERINNSYIHFLESNEY